MECAELRAHRRYINWQFHDKEACVRGLNPHQFGDIQTALKQLDHTAGEVNVFYQSCEAGSVVSLRWCLASTALYRGHDTVLRFRKRLVLNKRGINTSSLSQWFGLELFVTNNYTLATFVYATFDLDIKQHIRNI